MDLLYTLHLSFFTTASCDPLLDHGYLPEQPQRYAASCDRAVSKVQSGSGKHLFVVVFLWEEYARALTLLEFSWVFSCFFAKAYPAWVSSELNGNAMCLLSPFAVEDPA